MNNKKKWKIIGLVAVLLIVVISFLFLNKDKDEQDEKPVEETKEEVIKKESKVQEEKKVLYEVVDKALRENGHGEFIEGHGYTKNYFLTLNRKNMRSSQISANANLIVWTEIKGDEVKTTPLTDGESLVYLVKEKDSPFIKSGTDTLIVFYERSNSLQGYMGQTHVYKIEGDGSLKKVFEPKGVYGGIKKDKSGNLIVLEKIFNDPFGRYPLELKPYDVHYRKYEKEKWKTIQVENVDPVKKIEEAAK